jgi:hypothetical protein
MRSGAVSAGNSIEVNAMKKKFNAKTKSEKPFRLITIPAHTVRGFDGMSCHEDGQQGKLSFASDAYLEMKYGYDINVPERQYKFTSWEDVPNDMAKETKAALRQAVDADDRRIKEAQEAVMRNRIVILKPLSLTKNS